MKINKTVFFAVKLVISTASLAIVFSKTDISHVLDIMKGIGWLPFLSASALYISSQVFATIRWKLLLPEKFTVRRLFSLYMIGSFFSSFLPGIIGGDVVKAYYLNKDAKKLSLTLASIFMDRYMGYAGLILMGTLAFPFAMGLMADSVYKWLMPAIFVAFVIGSVLFFGLQLGKRFRVVAEFYDYFVILKTKKDIIFKTLLLSILIQFIGFVTVAMLAFAMGENIPLILLFVVLPIVNTITTLPISISGVGVREGTFVVLLGLVGIRPAVATSLSLAWFFSNFVGSLPGLLAYIRHTNKPRLE